MVQLWKESELDKIFARLSLLPVFWYKTDRKFFESNQKAGHVDSLELSAHCKATNNSIIERTEKIKKGKEDESKRKLTMTPFFD